MNFLEAVALKQEKSIRLWEWSGFKNSFWLWLMVLR